MYVCGCLWKTEGILDPLNLDLQVAVSCPMWVVGTELMSSTGAVCALNQRTIFPTFIFLCILPEYFAWIYHMPAVSTEARRGHQISLEPEIQVVVSSHVKAENRTRSSVRAASARICWALFLYTPPPTLSFKSYVLSFNNIKLANRVTEMFLNGLATFKGKFSLC